MGCACALENVRLRTSVFQYPVNDPLHQNGPSFLQHAPWLLTTRIRVRPTVCRELTSKSKPHSSVKVSVSPLSSVRMQSASDLSAFIRKAKGDIPPPLVVRVCPVEELASLKRNRARLQQLLGARCTFSYVPAYRHHTKSLTYFSLF